MSTITVHDLGRFSDDGTFSAAILVDVHWAKPVADAIRNELADRGGRLLAQVQATPETGDAAGDAMRAADALDQLRLDRLPIPALVLKLDSEAARGNSSICRSYVPIWASVVTSRGYRPVLRAEADVLYQAVQEAGGTHMFDGVFIDAFTKVDHADDAPPPNLDTIPGLPSDLYPNTRILSRSEGVCYAPAELLGKVTPEAQPAPVGDEADDAPPPKTAAASVAGTAGPLPGGGSWRDAYFDSELEEDSPAPGDGHAQALADLREKVERQDLVLSELRDDHDKLKSAVEELTNAKAEAKPAAARRAGPARKATARTARKATADK